MWEIPSRSTRRVVGGGAGNGQLEGRKRGSIETTSTEHTAARTTSLPSGGPTHVARARDIRPLCLLVFFFFFFPSDVQEFAHGESNGFARFRRARFFRARLNARLYLGRGLRRRDVRGLCVTFGGFFFSPNTSAATTVVRANFRRCSDRFRAS